MRQSYSSLAGVSGALLVAAGALVIAAPAAAQQASPAPARYLSWSGKAEMSPVADPSAAPQGQARYPGLIPRQSAAPVHMAPTPIRMASDARPSRYGGNRLTPASAWTSAPAASYAPAPEATPYPTESAYTPAPAPVPLPIPAAAPAPVPLPRPAARPDALVTTAPADAPMSAYADAPVPSLQAPQPGFEAAFDPMAPRRDALIFNMGRAEPAPLQAAPQSGSIPAATTVVPTADATARAPSQAAPTAYAADAPARQGARYYSVHRAAGHQPDATVMPASVYLDTAPVDLAEPPETALPARTVNGRARNIIPNEDPSLP